MRVPDNPYPIKYRPMIWHSHLNVMPEYKYPEETDNDKYSRGKTNDDAHSGSGNTLGKRQENMDSAPAAAAIPSQGMAPHAGVTQRPPPQLANRPAQPGDDRHSQGPQGLPQGSSGAPKYCRECGRPFTT
ncbi:hypothetical protein BDN72DRAFT_835103 [Pluteus cervinus]|uniref:Uncharacterized protein n=1 Tax=Pluteus cervinus TaxID=181527 RepID=A0ACD3B5D0_9AGAR|nr:hypothetical protein BDN72DRAFT_835103 [Pluteus cervinus]